MRRSILTASFLWFLALPTVAREPSVRIHSSQTTAEGDSGLTQVSVTVTVTRPGQAPAVATYTTVDGTATALDNDYLPKAGTFTIPPGETQSPPIILEIVGDRAVETDEAFTLVITFAAGAQNPPPYTITILNDDVPAVTVSNPRTPEGNSGTTAMIFDVTLTTAARVPIQATYSTVNVTAIAGTDYLAAAGSLTFAPGITMQTVVVTILSDTAVEPDEVFTLVVTPAGGLSGLGTGTIANDDSPPAAVANVSQSEGNSGTSTMTFNVALSTAVSFPVQAMFSTTDGTATAGMDYLAATGTLTFAAGVTVQPVSITILGDTTFEPDETFTLDVTSGGTKTTATGTIVNDDRAPPARIIVVSGNNQQGRLGQRLAQPLVVQVLDATAGVSGVPVTFRVTRGSALLEPASATTDAQGRASTNVTVNSVGAIDIEASASGFTTTFTLGASTGFEQRATGPVAVPIARALDQICARNEDPFNAPCRALSLLSDGELTPALERVAPQGSGAQSKVASEIASAITSGIGARLAAIRGGVERFSVAGLSLDINGRSIPLGAILEHGRLARHPFALQTAADPPTEGGYSGWSAFVSGNLGEGERKARDGQLGFDLSSRGLMVGADRLVGENVLGVSLNLMQLDSELTNNAGSVDTAGYALSIYGSRAGLFDGMHLDGSITVGRNRYDAEHIVEIAGLPLSRATSENHADVFAVAAGTGFEAHRGRTDFDLSLSGTWSRAKIEDLTEEGSGPLILFVQGHEIESLVATAGFSVRSAWPVAFGTLLGNLRGELIHEFEDGARLVTARFLRDRLGTSFTIPIDRPDANYGKISAGLMAVFPRGVSAYLEVVQDVIRDDLELRTIHFNLSKSF